MDPGGGGSQRLSEVERGPGPEREGDGVAGRQPQLEGQTAGGRAEGGRGQTAGQETHGDLSGPGRTASHPVTRSGRVGPAEGLLLSPARGPGPHVQDPLRAGRARGRCGGTPSCGPWEPRGRGPPSWAGTGQATPWAEPALPHDGGRGLAEGRALPPPLRGGVGPQGGAGPPHLLPPGKEDEQSP